MLFRSDDGYEYALDEIDESDEEDEAGDGEPAFGWPAALAVDDSDGLAGPRFTELDGWDRAAADLPGASQGESTGWD